MLPLGMAFNFGLALIATTQGTTMSAKGIVLLCCVGANALGALLMFMGQRRAGAWVTIVSSLPFLPVGFVCIVGARRVLDALSDDWLRNVRSIQSVPSEQYFASGSYVFRTVASGAVVALMGTYSLVNGRGMAFHVAIGISVIVAGLLQRARPVIAFASRHFEVRNILIAGKTTIVFGDIVSVSDHGNRIELIMPSGRVKISLKAIDKSERPRVVARIKNSVSAAKVMPAVTPLSPAASLI